jgi:hypothetical protein
MVLSSYISSSTPAIIASPFISTTPSPPTRAFLSHASRPRLPASGFLLSVSTAALNSPLHRSRMLSKCPRDVRPAPVKAWWRTGRGVAAQVVVSVSRRRAQGTLSSYAEKG